MFPNDVIRFEVCLGLILCFVFSFFVPEVLCQSDETCIRKERRRVLSYDFDFGPPRNLCCGCGRNRGDEAYTEWMLSFKTYNDPLSSLKTIRRKRAADPRLKRRKDEL